MGTKIIRNGTIITASDIYNADIKIVGEKIAEIAKDIDGRADEIIDATGKYIMPGGIDPHTHFDLPMFDTVSSDDHYTGHKAAAFGGTTTVMDFVPQDFKTLKESIDAWHEKADEKAAIDFGFHMNITKLNEQIKKEIPTLVGRGITTLKVFTAYNGRLRLQDGDIFEVMRIANNNEMLVMLHAENGDVIEILTNEAIKQHHIEPIWHAKTRPAWGAVDAVLRACTLSAQANASLYIVHMNTAGGVDQLRYAKDKGFNVFGETCPQYLFFTNEELKREDGAKWICSPPMRTKNDNERLWDGLQKGMISVIGTDHCPFFYDGTKSILYEGKKVKIPGKELGKNDFTKIPNGLPGVGDRMPIIWTKGVVENRITKNEFVALTSTNAAKLFGLYPQKGAILPGSDADLVIWDPEREVVYGVEYAKHRTDYNLYEGWKLKGYPEMVLLRGNIIVDHDKWLGKPGMGKYLYRKPGKYQL